MLPFLFGYITFHYYDYKRMFVLSKMQNLFRGVTYSWQQDTRVVILEKIVVQ